jgi:hypothetical protein
VFYVQLQTLPLNVNNSRTAASHHAGISEGVLLPDILSGKIALIFYST